VSCLETALASLEQAGASASMRAQLTLELGAAKEDLLADKRPLGARLDAARSALAKAEEKGEALELALEAARVRRDEAIAEIEQKKRDLAELDAEVAALAPGWQGASGALSQATQALASLVANLPKQLLPPSAEPAFLALQTALQAIEKVSAATPPKTAATPTGTPPRTPDRKKPRRQADGGDGNADAAGMQWEPPGVEVPQMPGAPGDSTRRPAERADAQRRRADSPRTPARAGGRDRGGAREDPLGR